VSHDDTEAAKWYRLAAEQGDLEAQQTLALVYSMGQGVQQDYAEAAKWYRPSADRGIASAQQALGGLHLSGGFGLPRNYAEGEKWVLSAAYQGNAFSALFLGMLYSRWLEIGPPKLGEAALWFRKAAADGDEMAHSGKDITTHSQYELGRMYLKGEGVQQSFTEAEHLFRLAADNGLADVQNELGNMYVNAQGVQQDFAEASKWYRLAANQGNAEAKKSLARLSSSALTSEKPNGVPQSDAKQAQSYVMLATWLVHDQPPSSTQTQFSSKEACDAAVTAVFADASRLRQSVYDDALDKAERWDCLTTLPD